MSSNFFIRAKYNAPYIYFIRLKDKLYIGETQHHPVIRWSSHLQMNGSFKMKLAQLGVNLDDTENDIEFYYIPLSSYLNGINANSKILSQAVEHAVHVEIKCNFLSFNGLHVISDTEKTAPNSKFRFRKEIEVISEQVVKLYKTHLMSI